MQTSAKPQGLGALAQAVIIRAEAVETKNQELKAAEAELTAAQEAFKSALLQAGLKSVKYRDWTVYLQSVTFASLKSDESDDPKRAAMEALKANGLGWMVKETVNKNTLSAWVREQPIDGATLSPTIPPPVKPHIVVFQDMDVRVKKA